MAVGVPSGATSWLVLVHQLPPRPLYLRAKVRRRLAAVGALAVKNSVYVLPDRPDCLEDFQWIAQEAVAGGGEAFVCRAEFIEGLSAATLAGRFAEDAGRRWAPIKDEFDDLLRHVRKAGGAPDRATAARLRRARGQAENAAKVDFFASTTGREVSAIMNAIEQTQERRQPAGRSRAAVAPPEDLIGRVWVTRADPHIDRLATAWLIRRFIDPAARFRFVPATGGATRRGELSFDMMGADFTHEGDRCTFETVVRRLGLKDTALTQIGEIVHDIDLKDAKFGREDAAGVHRLVQGLAETHADSTARIAAALPVFDALYASLGGGAVAKARSRVAPRPSAGSTRPRRKARG